MFGADEAGKGPVFGPMVAAAVAVPEASVLPDGVGDSKEIAPERREGLAASLRADDRVAVGVATVPVERIDDPETDMNTLTVAAQAEAIAELGDDGEGLTVGDVGEEIPTDRKEGIVDAGDTDAGRFARRVGERLPFDAAVHAEHGADQRYPVVGAASVVAKVERDRRLAAIADEYGDVGSGYPSDPTTREFLASYVEEHGAVPPFARASWSTCQDALRRASQSSLEEF